jgi:ankyrin repeat protein
MHACMHVGGCSKHRDDVSRPKARPLLASTPRRPLPGPRRAPVSCRPPLVLTVLAMPPAAANSVRGGGDGGSAAGDQEGHLDLHRAQAAHADHAADINAVMLNDHDHGDDALMHALAADEGQVEVVGLQVLEAAADTEGVIKRGVDVTLTGAAYNGDVAVVRQLLEAGADIEAVNMHGASPLRTAAHNGHGKVVRQLLEAGADIEAVNTHRSNALTLAAQLGHVEVVRLLLEAGAYIEAVTNHGSNALLYAASAGHMEVVQLLLEAGADPNSRRIATSNLPTVVAMANGHPQIVEALLRAGADVGAACHVLHTTKRQALAARLRGAPALPPVSGRAHAPRCRWALPSPDTSGDASQR